MRLGKPFDHDDDGNRVRRRRLVQGALVAGWAAYMVWAMLVFAGRGQWASFAWRGGVLAALLAWSICYMFREALPRRWRPLFYLQHRR